METGKKKKKDWEMCCQRKRVICYAEHDIQLE